MLAAFTPQYGSPDVITVREAPEPSLDADQILVQVHAAPVTAGDRRLRAADFPGASAILGRLMMGVFKPRHAIQGSMFAGRVLQVGADVTRFAVGDEVFGSADHGAYAERLVVAHDGAIAVVPEGVSTIEAAGVPYGAGTALHFLRDLANVQPGEKVLILGASGGVGRYAIQIAKHLGAHVTAVCGAPSTDLVRSLGADAVLDHRTQDFTDQGSHWDVVFDVADRSSFGHSRRVLTPTGRYLTLYISLRAAWNTLRTQWSSGPKAIFAIAIGDAAQAEELAGLLADGAIRPVIAERFGLQQIREAHALAESGMRGEVLVCPTEELLRIGVAAVA